MNAKTGISVVLLLATVGCSDAAPAAQAGQLTMVADVQQVMLAILEPAAEHYWDAVGWIDTPQGEIVIEPTSDEEWEAIRNAAFVIAESGNLLMMQGRALDDPAWMPMSQSLVDIGQAAIEAAESKDKLQVFNTGAEVYYVCTNCHAAFALETMRPADERMVEGNQ